MVGYRRPAPELVGVAYGPDVPDPVACDVDRHHGDGDALLLSHQTGLTVDRALHERQVGHSAGHVEGVARDLLAAFGRAEHSGDQAAAVGDHRGVRVEQADEGVDIFGLPGPFEVPDDASQSGLILPVSNKSLDIQRPRSPLMLSGVFASLGAASR